MLGKSAQVCSARVKALRSTMEEPQRPGFAGVTEAHIEAWNTQGYCVFEQIIPPALLDELRGLTDAARVIARDEYRTSELGKTLASRGRAEAQRLQPLEREDLPFAPLEAYYNLAPLKEAIAAVHPDPAAQLGKLDAEFGKVQIGVLIEPEKEAWCTNWHR